MTLTTRTFAMFVAALALAGLGALTVSSALRTDALAVRLMVHTSREGTLPTAARALARLREQGAAVDGFAADLDAQMDAEVWALDRDLSPLVGGAAPPDALALARHALDRAEPVPSVDARRTLAAAAAGSGAHRTVLVTRLRGGLRPQLAVSVLRVSFALLLAALVCLLFARSLTTPLLALQGAARRIASGDLSARAGDAPALRRHDELGELARDFDTMAARLESARDSQVQLLGDISHELRSPLARLGVAVELLRRQSGPEVEGALARIERESERMQGLIAELLTLTQLETGGEDDVAADRVALGALVQDVVADAQFEAETRGVTVEAQVPDSPLACSGRQELLRRALENVVRNALRYTQGGTAVRVTLRAEGAVATLTVRDHGPGVPGDALAHLFRPFWRVGTDRDRATGGAGLGLAIAARAVALHGGTIAAANAEGGGLIVTLRLPLAVTEPSGAASTAL